MFGVTFAGNPDLRPLLTTGRRRAPAAPHDPAAGPDRHPLAGGRRALGPSAAGGRVAARPRTRPGPPGVPAEWQP